ncbi:glycosyltransferase [Geomesophilobacter sediminis]|uniref:Glycosyltransferase n=1 Tax=Geomesophilobacter sediminis TaxID=2798584 RepID=A0A8J7JHZ9_9BACT|nr:glycosyltransferase [Geomesophilobacter sediminis]MBJ6724080.1 glycosyltransferase [Geomesophilobacter sediminis]
MRIVFLRHSLLNRGGDKMIATHASFLAAQGHDVVIRTNLLKTVFSLDPRVRVEPLPFPGKLGTLVTAALSRQCADVVVADIVVLALLLSIRNRKRVLYFAQDYDESYYRFTLQRLFIRLLYGAALSFLRVRSIAVSKRLAQLLSQRFGAKVGLSENGVDTTIFYPEPDPDLIASKQGRQALLLLSRSDARKGFDIAQRTVAALKTGLPLEIWTVGENATGGFPGFLHRDFGYLDESALRRVFSSADLFLYPSRHEGFPLMVLEAFACGCPVVTTDAVPYAEHDENSLVCRIEDAHGAAEMVEILLADVTIRRRLAENGKALASRQTLHQASVTFADQLGAWYAN